MARRLTASAWTRSLQRSVDRLTRSAVRAGTRALADSLRAPGVARPAPARPAARPAAAAGTWVSGLAVGAAGVRRYRLFKPPGTVFGERLPLLVMLHGCGQDADSFAASTRMHRIAARERFLVLYPEQDRRAHPHGCWNWYATRSGQAAGEAGLLLAAIDQACLLYHADPRQVAVAGLSAGAGMAALLATRHPERFRAVVMHSGVPPGAADSTVTALAAMRGRRAAQPAAPGTAWPPLLVIYGDADDVVAASNGEAAAQLWAQAAGARPGASRRVCRGNRHPMVVTDYRGGGRVVASACRIEGLGHAWSGGDARHRHGDARGPDASRLAWAFVARQLRAAGTRIATSRQRLAP